MSKKLEILIEGKDQLSPAARSAQKGLDGFSDSVENADKKTGSLWKQMAGGALVAQGVSMAISGLTRGISEFVSSSITAYNTQAKAEAQLAAVLKSTAGAAGLNADELKRMASELQRTTAFGDEAVMGAQNILLTFTKIGKETFPDTLKATLNMSQALGMDLKSAAIMAGKAMNDPILGMTAMSRAGIQFTKEQKETAKALVETGQVAKAQAIILKELETQFGGSAAAFTKTFEGQLTQFKNAWGDMKEEIGGAIIQELQPLLKSVSDWFSENRESIIEFGRNAAQTFGDLASAGMGLLKVLYEVRGIIAAIPNVVNFAAATAGDARKFMNEQAALVMESRKNLQEFILGNMSALDQAISDSRGKVESEKAAIHATDMERIKQTEDLESKRQEREEAARVKAAALIQKEVAAIDGLLEKYNHVPVTLYDQLLGHQKITNELGIQHKELNQLINYMEVYADGLARLPERKNPFGDFSGVTVPGMGGITMPEYKTPDAPVKKIAAAWAETAAKVETYNRLINSGIGLLEKMGIKIGDNIKSIVSGGTQAVTGIGGFMATGNPADLISGISGVIDALSGIADVLGFMGDGTDDMVDRFKSLGVVISEDVVNAIKEMEKAGIDAGVALAIVTDQIIEQGTLTAENMDGYKKMIQDIFMQLDNGRLSAAEATKEVGDAFVALAKKAKDAGLEGGAALTDLLNDARNRGLVGKDIMEYLDAERAKGLSALSGHIQGTVDSQDSYNRALLQTHAMFQSMDKDGKTFFQIIDAMGPALDTLAAVGEAGGYADEGGLLAQLFGFKEFAEQNKGLLSNLQATQTYMESMANTGILTADQFAGFQVNLKQYQDQLQAAGASEADQMRALLPMIAKQAWYAKEYGFAVDENTQRLIDQAREQGYNLEAAIPFEERQIELMEMQNELMAALIDAVGGELPAAFNRSTAAAAAFGAQMGAAVDQSQRLADAVGGGKNVDEYRGDGAGIIPGFRDGTHGMWVDKPSVIRFAEGGPEFLEEKGNKFRATPAREMGDGRGGVTVQRLEVVLPNVRDPYDARQIISDIRMNRFGVRTALEKMIGGTDG